MRRPRSQTRPLIPNRASAAVVAPQVDLSHVAGHAFPCRSRYESTHERCREPVAPPHRVVQNRPSREKTRHRQECARGRPGCAAEPVAEPDDGDDGSEPPTPPADEDSVATSCAPRGEAERRDCHGQLWNRHGTTPCSKDLDRRGVGPEVRRAATSPVYGAPAVSAGRSRVGRSAGRRASFTSRPSRNARALHPMRVPTVRTSVRALRATGSTRDLGW